MNIQLFIVMVLVASSLLMLSDRASAKELNKQRYLQTNIEQFCCEDIAPNQDNETIDGNIYSSLFEPSLLSNKDDLIYAYSSQQTALLASKLHPRAPPVFLISLT